MSPRLNKKEQTPLAMLFSYFCLFLVTFAKNFLAKALYHLRTALNENKTVMINLKNNLLKSEGVTLAV